MADEYAKVEVSAMEYEALLNMDKMLRLAMSVPDVGQFLVTAIQALDQVRCDQGLLVPEAAPRPIQLASSSNVSDLAGALIQRAMREGS